LITSQKFTAINYKSQPDYAGWSKLGRVVARVEWHQGELFPNVGFILTNMCAKAKGVVHFYNGRGTVEQWIKFVVFWV